MQSETADFAPGAATGRSSRNVRVVFDSGSFPLLYENMKSSIKPEIHNVLHYHQLITDGPSRRFREIYRRVAFEI